MARLWSVASVRVACRALRVNQAPTLRQTIAVNVRPAFGGGSTGSRALATAASDRREDPYKLLGVPRTATPDEIKKAYRKQAMEWHPDRHPVEKRKEAERRFGAIASAYEILSDPDKRRQFDLGGGAPEQPGGFQRGGFPSGGFPFASSGFHTQESAERLFREAFGGSGFDELFGQLLGQTGRMGSTVLQVGMEVQVLPELGAVLRACRECGIASDNDGLRTRALGRRGRIIKADPKDQSVKVKVDGVGDVWFGARAVRPQGSARSPGGMGMSGFPGFGSMAGFGGGTGARAAGGGVVQMKQELVTTPDGRRVMKVTRLVQGADGSLHEETSETPA